MPPEISDLSEENAIRLWTRRQSGAWTEDDERQLAAWLAAAPTNEIAYERVVRLWSLAGGLERDGYDVVVPRPMLKVRKVAVACALVLTAALAVQGWLHMDRWWNGVSVRWVTARGEFRTLQLEDGTQVSLDADSELIVKLGAHARRVSLVRGEALFAVTHEASRPFEVEMGPGRLVDLGTRFDVEKLPDAVRVAVFEGRVGVKTRHGEVVLGAGRRGGYDNLGNLLTTDQADTAAVARADGLRHFESESLPVVLARMSRYHPVTFVFSEPQLQQLRVSGTFRLNDLNLFLRTLCTVLPVDVRWNGPQRVEIVPRGAATG
jgi:transmembrane sensor